MICQPAAIHRLRNIDLSRDQTGMAPAALAAAAAGGDGDPATLQRLEDRIIGGPGNRPRLTADGLPLRPPANVPLRGWRA